MVTTIQQVLRPFFVTYFIFGLSSYPIKESTSRIPWITCLSVLYSLIIWLSYAYLYYYTVTFFTWKELHPCKIYFIASLTNTSTTIVSAIMNFYYQEKLRICMKRLAAVDNTLEQLGTPKEYQKVHIYSKRILIGWIVFELILNFYETLSLHQTRQVAWALFLPYISNHCTYINNLTNLLFIFLLWYIGTRFDKINEHMQCLLVKHVPKCTWRKPAITFHRYVIYSNDNKHILWISMHLHLELCRIARELNLIFGTQMTFEIISDIASITIMCFVINILLIQYSKYVTLSSWFIIGFWILIYIMKIWITNYICECVRVKAKKIDKLFHQLTNIIQYADVSQEIYQFILQAIQHPLKFTGMGLFYFGNGFLRKLCTTVLMYVIIMIQMKVPLI